MPGIKSRETHPTIDMPKILAETLVNDRAVTSSVGNQSAANRSEILKLPPPQLLSSLRLLLHPGCSDPLPYQSGQRQGSIPRLDKSPCCTIHASAGHYGS